MKKRNIVVALCVGMLLTMVACSKKPTDYTASSEEIVIPENSVIPDAATAVEKIINNEDVIEIHNDDNIEQSETVEETENTIDVSIFYVFGDYSEFKVSKESIKADFNADELLGKLVIHNIVPIDTDVLDFEITSESGGVSTIRLDISSRFREYLDTMSDDAERAIIASVANTFLYNYDADEIFFYSGGKPLKTQSAEYADAIVWAETPLK